jgi:hypothetical protein
MPPEAAPSRANQTSLRQHAHYLGVVETAATLFRSVGPSTPVGRRRLSGHSRWDAFTVKYESNSRVVALLALRKGEKYGVIAKTIPPAVSFFVKTTFLGEPVSLLLHLFKARDRIFLRKVYEGHHLPCAPFYHGGNPRADIAFDYR